MTKKICGMCPGRLAALFFAAAMMLFANSMVAQQSPPQQIHLQLDPAATEVHFTLKDTLHSVHGTFQLKTGEIVFDPKSGLAHGMIQVETGSGASGNDTRDGRMKREFLEVTSFPIATFEPQQVTGFDPAAESQKISVSGTMTLHGTGHAMTMEFAVSRQGGVTVATTHFAIPYVAWGIKDPSIPFVKVEKEVSIDIVAKGRLTSQ